MPRTVLFECLSGSTGTTANSLLFLRQEQIQLLVNGKNLVSAEDTVPDSVVCLGTACTDICPACGSGSCGDADKMKNRGSTSNLELGNIYNQIFALNMGTMTMRGL